MTVVRNTARCLLCGETIESKHAHDLVWCPCGSLFVDGGTAYLRRGFSGEGTWEEIAETRDDG